MAVFDVFCAESGLVLGGDARLILVAESSPGRFEPIALPIAGRYDRHGCIDLPEPFDTIVMHVASFCCRLDFDDLQRDAAFDERLSEMTHAATDDRWGRLWGRKVSYALVDGRVYAAIAETVEDTFRSAIFEELFERAFPVREMSAEVYAPLDASVQRALRADLVEFVRYRTFGTALLPVRVDKRVQFTGYSAKKSANAAKPYVKAARRKYARYPRILDAVEANAAYWLEKEARS